MVVPHTHRTVWKRHGGQKAREQKAKLINEYSTAEKSPYITETERNNTQLMVVDPAQLLQQYDIERQNLREMNSKTHTVHEFSEQVDLVHELDSQLQDVGGVKEVVKNLPKSDVEYVQPAYHFRYPRPYKPGHIRGSKKEWRICCICKVLYVCRMDNTTSKTCRKTTCVNENIRQNIRRNWHLRRTVKNLYRRVYNLHNRPKCFVFRSMRVWRQRYRDWRRHQIVYMYRRTYTAYNRNKCDLLDVVDTLSRRNKQHVWSTCYYNSYLRNWARVIYRTIYNLHNRTRCDLILAARMWHKRYYNRERKNTRPESWKIQERIRKRIAARRWRQENPEKFKEYVEKNRESYRAAHKRYREKHKEKIYKRKREYFLQHQDEIKERSRQRRLNNLEKARLGERKRRQKAKERMAIDPVYAAERRAAWNARQKRYYAQNKKKFSERAKTYREYLLAYRRAKRVYGGKPWEVDRRRWHP